MYSNCLFSSAFSLDINKVYKLNKSMTFVCIHIFIIWLSESHVKNSLTYSLMGLIVLICCNNLCMCLMQSLQISIFQFSDMQNCTGLRPIYVIFFEFLPISFQMKNNDDMRL